MFLRYICIKCKIIKFFKAVAKFVQLHGCTTRNLRKL